MTNDQVTRHPVQAPSPAWVGSSVLGRLENLQGMLCCTTAAADWTTLIISDQERIPIMKQASFSLPRPLNPFRARRADRRGLGHLRLDAVTPSRPPLGFPVDRLARGAEREPWTGLPLRCGCLLLALVECPARCGMHPAFTFSGSGCRDAPASRCGHAAPAPAPPGAPRRPSARRSLRRCAAGARAVIVDRRRGRGERPGERPARGAVARGGRAVRRRRAAARAGARARARARRPAAARRARGSSVRGGRARGRDLVLDVSVVVARRQKKRSPESALSVRWIAAPPCLSSCTD